VLTNGIFTNDGDISGGDGGTAAHGVGGAGGIGMNFVFGGTLTNGGTISGGSGGSGFYGSGANGNAVRFGNGDSRLIVDQGGVFNGTVSATAIFYNVIELTAVNGSISGIGTFTGFDRLFVDSGGTWNFAGVNVLNLAVTNNGTITQTAADALTINGNIDGTGVIELDPTTVTLNGDVGAGQTIDFEGSGDRLNLGDPADFDATILDFDETDLIDLTGIDFNALTSFNFDYGTGLLTVVTSVGTFTFNFGNPGDFTGEFFHITEDGDGSMLITEDAVCYCPGTLILTDRGEVPVETLAIGDRVVTVSGKHKPIRWIGRRSHGGRFITGKKNILPIRIKAGALGENLPRRDLVISPQHAMFIDGLLIPASELVNGISIVQENVDEVHYIHVELDAHDVILAEGSASETFIDDHSRGIFSNAAEFDRLYPDRPRIKAQYCAPRVTDGYELEAIRQRIAQRAMGLQRAA
jgi:hypothetical protein